MTIDEAIAEEKEKAKEQKTKYDKCHTRMKYCCEMCFHNPKCNEVAEYHEQLAEWLEDYKRIKMLIPIEQALKAEYNKAIDDVMNMLNDIEFGGGTKETLACANATLNYIKEEVKQLISDG